MKLSIIVPVYNEEKTIGEVLRRLTALKLLCQKEIIAVDDGSSDKTASEIKNLKLKIKNLMVITHKTNRGKGAAIRTGIKQAAGDYILIHDADMEYNPDEIPKLLKPIISNKKLTAPLAVYGSRFLYKNVAIPKAYYFGNKFLTWLTNIFYGTNLTDMETCYKLIPNNIKWDKLSSNGFDIEPEITITLIKNKIPIIEVPIRYFSRSRKAGKKLTFKDAFCALRVIMANISSQSVYSTS